METKSVNSKLIIALALLIFNLPLAAKNQAKIDSLKQVIAAAKLDTNRVKALLKLGDQYEYNAPDTALFYYNKALKTAKQINNKKFIAKSYSYLGIIYKDQSNYPKALAYYQKALKINEEIGDKDGIAANLGNIGIIYGDQSNYPKALAYYQKALKINKEIGDKYGIARNLGNIGLIYCYQSNYPKALAYDQKSLKINKEIGDKSSIAANLGNIGVIYADQSNYPKALAYDQKSLKIFEEIGNKRRIAYNLVNIGVIYADQSNYSKALAYFQKALKILEEIGDKRGIAANLGNIGIIYADQSNYPKALAYYQKALKIFEEIGNKSGIALNLGNIVGLYNDLKQYNKAILYGNKSLAIAKEIGDINRERKTSEKLAKAYIGLGNYKKALEYKDNYIELNDSIFNKEKTKDIAKLEAKYEYEKKAAMDSIANAKQMEIKNAEIAKINIEKEAQRKQRNYLLIGLILILVFVGFVIRSYIQKRKANILLQKQKQEIAEKNEELNQQNEEIRAQRDEISKQKNKIEAIHKEVSQSIDYAKRIQTSILPDGSILKKYLSDYFIFFQPKDVVSGDFYWATHVENHTIITVADCTGHGVPGAFMSMLGVSFLREIVQKEYITHTGVILRKLRKEIIKALKQTGEPGEQKDGMDMSLISINHETGIVQFSGANNPLYIIKSVIARKNNEAISTKNEQIASLPAEVRNDDLNLVARNDEHYFYELKPDKMPIAIYERMDKFTNHKIQLQKGDQLYLFSDGFADQFGGPKGKKFKYKPFKQLLMDNCQLSMQEQKTALEKTFTEWIGNLDQIDDITVVGIKI